MYCHEIAYDILIDILMIDNINLKFSIFSLIHESYTSQIHLNTLFVVCLEINSIKLCV